MTVVFKAFTGSFSAMCLGMMTFQPLAKSGKQQPRRSLAVNDHGIRVRRLDALNKRREHGPRGLTMPLGGFMIRSMVYFTSADEKGMPSCHFTPLCR